MENVFDFSRAYNPQLFDPEPKRATIKPEDKDGADFTIDLPAASNVHNSISKSMMISRRQ